MSTYRHDRFLTKLAGELRNHLGRCRFKFEVSDHQFVLLDAEHFRGLIQDRLLDVETRSGMKDIELGLGLGGE
jgi:hypothetical protein